MRKPIFFLAASLFIFACSPRKNTFVSRHYQSFTTYYNTLYNSQDALDTEMKTRKESYVDNFYDSYIQLLKTEDQAENILGGSNADLSTSNANKKFGAKPPISSPQRMSGVSQENGFPKSMTGRGGSTVLEIAEAKALKAITKHSMEFNGVEKNKEIFDAYILLAKVRMYQGKNLEALDALNSIFANMGKDKRIDLAKIYQGRIFTKMGDYYRAFEVFSALDDKPKVKKEYRKLLSLYFAELLLKSDKKEEAIEELDLAFHLNKNRETRSRIAFLRGQILTSLGKISEARESFVTAYKYANDFEFEVKSQIEIAKSYDPQVDEYEVIKKYLENNSSKGIYGSKKNEFYYALGLLAKKGGKEKEAEEYFRKALKEKLSDPQVRGLTYYEVAQDFYNKSDYLAAGVYYDSAITSMTYRPHIEKLTSISKNIKQLSSNYYLMKKNDSILNLTKMSADQLNSYFGEFITQLKAKEQKEELERQKAEKEKSFQVADFSLGKSNTSGFANTNGGSGRGKFYFENETTVAKGASDFKRIWGDRSLADNWRYSANASSIEDLKNEAMGAKNVQDPRRYEVAYYTEKIPTEPKKITALKKQRDTAQLGLGIMYYEYFDNQPLATKTLYSLVDLQPDEETELKALYSLFSMNYEQHPQDAARAKELILSKFPYTPYAEFVKNPKSNAFSKSDEEVLTLYKSAYDLYTEEKFPEAQAVISQALEKYPKDVLVPKFYLLQAYVTGKTAGKEIMILQLEQITLNYSKTEEGEKAEELLKYLKSGIQFETTDAEGNKIPATPVPQPSPPKSMREKVPNRDRMQELEPINSNSAETENETRSQPPRSKRGRPQSPR